MTSSTPESHSSAVVTEIPETGIRRIVLNRPDRLNTMNEALLVGLHRELQAASADSSCRVVVLTGAGRAFCAGADLTERGEPAINPLSGEPRSRVRTTFDRQHLIASLITEMRAMPQPIVVAVNGAATGGGIALVLGSDVRLAGRSARFGVAFIRAGFSACDIGTSWLLPRVVGVARAQELMLTGRVFDVDEAERIGLVVEVHDDDALAEAALAKARQIMLNGPWQVALTKQGMWSALEMPALATAIEYENRQQILTSMTKDGAESRAAFFEKRPPRYVND